MKERWTSKKKAVKNLLDMAKNSNKNGMNDKWILELTKKFNEA